MPTVWSSAIAIPWQAQAKLDISNFDIRMALTRIVKHKSLSKTHAFCFFIDGLDEFEETAHHDHRSIVELLESWTQTAPDMIKVCVSSREYNVFMSTFSPKRRIRLHEMTEADLRKFSEDRLYHIADLHGREDLIDAIVQKAQGIFLWASLVTKSIRQQAENGTNSEDLKNELQSLPDELEGLYEHIFKSLNKSTRGSAYRTFRMLEVAKEYETTISTLAYSYMEEYERNPEFSVTEEYLQCITDSETVEKRRDMAQKRLNGWCRDLIEPDFESNLEYVHRSIAEFLKNARIKDMMISALGGFNPQHAISQLFLSEIRVLKRWKQDEYPPSSRIRPLLRMRCEHGLDKAPYSYLTCLEQVTNRMPWEDLRDKAVYCEVLCDSTLICINVSCDSDSRVHIAEISEPLYLLTYLGYYDYPLWKLKDQAAIDSIEKLTVLAYSDLAGHTSTNRPVVIGNSVLRALLERGILKLESTTDLWNVWANSEDHTYPQLSLWHKFFIFLILWTENIERDHLDVDLSDLIELLLQFLPNLNFSFNLSPGVTNSKGKHRRIGTIGFGEGNQTAELDFPSWRASESFQYSSLRSWIQAMDFKRKDRLLELYDARAKEMQDMKTI
jgi:hypothetical protein